MSLDSFFSSQKMTEDVMVRAAPHFLEEQSSSENGRWFWSYHIRIENHGGEAVQLLTRHWRITDGRGAVNHVDGDGVVGEQPVIQPGGAHDYVSGCPLTTSTGTMEGHYRFVRADGSTFLVEIPEICLATPATAQ